MKINLSKTTFSGQIIVIFIVLLVYTFFFIDEELLVSLMTTVVLLGAYNMGSNSVNALFMSNINSLFQKFSIYILMNIHILYGLILKFNKISLVWVYNSFYAVLFMRAVSKIKNVEVLLFHSVNLLVHNIVSFLLSNNLSKSYIVSSRFSDFSKVLVSNSFSRLFLDAKNSSVKDSFVLAISKLILKS